MSCTSRRESNRHKAEAAVLPLILTRLVPLIHHISQMTTDDGVEHAPQSPPASIAVDPADHRDAFLNVNGGDGQIKTFHVLLTGFGVSACPSPPGPVQPPRRTRNEFTSHSPS
jgi:hypothetical protein